MVIVTVKPVVVWTGELNTGVGALGSSIRVMTNGDVLAVDPAASLAMTTTVTVPVSVGVPLMTPVLALSESPTAIRSAAPTVAL